MIWWLNTAKAASEGRPPPKQKAPAGYFLVGCLDCTRRGGKGGPEVAINVQAGAGFQLPYNPGTHSPVVAIEVGEHEALGTITVAELLELVRDPIASEKAARVAEDPKLRASAHVRKDVQRVVKGAKATNAKKYARYIIEGINRRRPVGCPPVTLYTPEALGKVDIANGAILLLIPKGGFLLRSMVRPSGSRGTTPLSRSAMSCFDNGSRWLSTTGAT